jgi:hypothetical protein
MTLGLVAGHGFEAHTPTPAVAMSARARAVARPSPYNKVMPPRPVRLRHPP